MLPLATIPQSLPRPTKLAGYDTQEIIRLLKLEVKRINRGAWAADPAWAWSLQMELDARRQK